MYLEKTDKQALEKESQKSEKMTRDQLLRKTKKLFKQKLLLSKDNDRLQHMSEISIDLYKSLQASIFKRRKLEIDLENGNLSQAESVKIKAKINKINKDIYDHIYDHINA